MEYEGNSRTTNRTTLGTGKTTFRMIAMYTISTAAIVLGIPGNTLINHAVRSRKQMQNARNYFIVNLASSDVIALLISVPFATLIFGHVLRYMPEAVCKSLLFNVNR